MVRFDAFLKGFRRPLEATLFLWRHPGLKRVAVLPLLVNAAVYALVLGAAGWLWLRHGADALHVDWRFAWGTGHYLGVAANWLIDLSIFAILLLFAYFTFTAAGMVLASPFNDMLSERVEALARGGGGKSALSFRQTALTTALSVLENLRISLWQLALSLLALPFLLLPVIGYLPLLAVGAYFLGRGFFEVGLTRNFLRRRHFRGVVEERRLELLGLGAAMQLLFLVPLVGLLALPVGVVAGTLLYCDCDWEKHFAERGITPPPGFVPPRRSQADGNITISRVPG